jgi:hypothetical protein
MKSLPVYLLTLLVIPNFVWGEDIYLEGISIVGTKKNAYLSLEGTRIVVTEGEAVGSWQVKQIIRKAVLLTSENGSKQTTLALHARLATVEERETYLEEDTVPETFIVEENEPATFELQSVLPEIPQQAVVTDEEIPDGHHKVYTPFGDFVVKDSAVGENNKPLKLDSSLQAKETTIPSTEPLEIPADGEVPAGYHKIRTPFGEFLVEDEAKLAEDRAQLE